VNPVTVLPGPVGPGVSLYIFTKNGCNCPNGKDGINPVTSSNNNMPTTGSYVTTVA
jgi:hypothetical protein